jgi:hypothetical protein
MESMSVVQQSDLSWVAWLVIGVIGVSVVMLYTNLLRRLNRKKDSEATQVQWLQKAFRAMGNPWKAEDKSLEELSEQVKKLKEK